MAHKPERQYHKTARELVVEKVISEIQQGLKVLVLMRGLPGSGKSYLAKEILWRSIGSTDYSTFIYSTDDYFKDQLTGAYKFDSKKISEAHEYNKTRAYTGMAIGISPIIIDNTNTEAWEMLPYVQRGIQYNYTVEIVEPYTKWAFKLNELAQRNIHNVQLVKLHHMFERYEKDVSVTKLLGMVGITIPRPPSYRGFPPLLPFSADNNLVNVHAQAESVIYVSDDDELQRENTSPNKNLQGKHNLTTTPHNLESEFKKQRIYNVNAPAFSPTSEKSPGAIDKARNVYPLLNLSSWGLSENAVSSWETWDVVNPLKCNGQLKEPVWDDDTSSYNVETREISTNTYGSDFALLSNESSTAEARMLVANNRDINKGLCINPFNTPPKRTLIDKSSMTDDVLFIKDPVMQVDEKQLTDLAVLFPNIPIEYLSDVFEKCKGDVNWAVNILLDDNKEILPANNTTVDCTNNVPPVSHVTATNLEDNMQDLKIAGSPDKAPITKKASDEHIKAIKKHIEQNIEINQDYYSQHVLKLKNQKHTLPNNYLESPCSSQQICHPQLGSETNSIPKTSTIVLSDSESDADIDFPDHESENEEIIELNLGSHLVSQLEAKLGFEEVMPQGFLPVVQLPISLARQLYATYVESILRQMEVQNNVLNTISKQDEELALILQEQERHMESKNANALDLQAIRNEQSSESVYQIETELRKKETSATLATKMALQKLSSAFPTVNMHSLMEIYHAYNNSYDRTLEVLLSSSDRNSVYDPDGTLREPPITEAVLNEMKQSEEELTNCMNIPDVPKSAHEYRTEANMHHGKHDELILKAQLAYQRKQYPVAQFYSGLAKTHTQLYDQANNLAASAFLNEHSQKLQNFYTLDLHFLYVKEAVAALDIFIDTNIHLLNEKKPTENLFIITGRGNRSEQGRSKLKPVIMSRLRKRKIRYWELNPGLLKIRLMHTSPLTSNI